MATSTLIGGSGEPKRDEGGNPVISFPSMDKEKMADQAAMRRLNIEAQWEDKATADRLAKDKAAAYQRYQDRVSRQGFVNTAELPWSGSDWDAAYPLFIEWEAKQNE
jgi:hypothetical protein